MRVLSRQSYLGVALGLSVSIVGCSGSETASSAGTTRVASADRATGTSAVAEYRHRNHGGVIRLIAVSLQELNLTPDQRATLEAIRADLLTKMEPGRAAGAELANVLADGVASGAVDREKAEAATTKLSAATRGSARR